MKLFMNHVCMIFLFSFVESTDDLTLYGTLVICKLQDLITNPVDQFHFT